MLLAQLSSRKQEKLEVLRGYFESEMAKYGQGGAPVLAYLKAQLKGYYSDDYAKQPEIKKRVDLFLSWIEKNPGLEKRFFQEVLEGKTVLRIYSRRNISDEEHAKFDILNSFSGWLGAKYAQDMMSGEGIMKRPIGKIITRHNPNIGDTSGRGNVILNVKREAATLGSAEERWKTDLVNAINSGMHESAHVVAANNLLVSSGEAMPAYALDKYALPMKMMEGENEGFFWGGGRRDFYNTFLNLEKAGESVPGRGEIGKMLNEYAVFAVYPWLSGDGAPAPGTKRRGFFHPNWPGDFALSGLFGYESSQRRFVKHVGDVFGMDEGKKKTLLGVFKQWEDEIRRYEKKTGKAATDYEFVKKFVDLMTGAFGVPNTAETPGYTHLDYIPRKTKSG